MNDPHGSLCDAMKQLVSRQLAIVFWVSAMASLTRAGPPFRTDDPKPVEYQNWEVYMASQMAGDSEGWSGTAPHVEMNYGAFPNLQLHIIAPLSFVAPAHGSARFGYGDTEVGVKYRFVEEAIWRPQIGAFPQMELPTGDSERNLGNGYTQLFLPLWIQKSWDLWTSYGGGGYLVNPGAENLDWWFFGWLLQYQLFSCLAVGAEVFHETVKEAGGDSDTHVNMGAIFDFNERFHLLLSAGSAVQGPRQFQGYIGLQWTWGPDKPDDD